MARRSYDEKIAEAEKKQEQLRAQVREWKSKKSQEARKKRTKRLIEIGGTVESVLGRELTEDDKDRLYKFLVSQNERGNYFTDAMNNKEQV